MTDDQEAALGVAPCHAAGAELHQDVEGRIWLHSSRSPATYMLNPMAFALWELCDGETTVNEMVTAICDLFDAEGSRVQADVIGLVRDLFRARLLDGPSLSRRSG